MTCRKDKLVMSSSTGSDCTHSRPSDPQGRGALHTCQGEWNTQLTHNNADPGGEQKASRPNNDQSHGKTGNLEDTRQHMHAQVKRGLLPCQALWNMPAFFSLISSARCAVLCVLLLVHIYLFSFSPACGAFPLHLCMHVLPCVF